MTDVDPFNFPIPEGFTEIDGAVEWATFLQRVINDLRDRTGGAVDNVTGAVEVISGQADTLPGGQAPVWDQPDLALFLIK